MDSIILLNDERLSTHRAILQEYPELLELLCRPDIVQIMTHYRSVY